MTYNKDTNKQHLKKGEKNITGYQIQNITDRLNAFTDDKNQTFSTLEEARGWADEIWEQIQECEKDCDYLEEDERTKKEDMIIAYYENGVQRGEYPLFA